MGTVLSDANRHDSPLLWPTFDAIVVERFEPGETEPQNLCLDNGYKSKLNEKQAKEP